jgi:hypothetical protein
MTFGKAGGSVDRSRFTAIRKGEVYCACGRTGTIRRARI